MPYAVNMTPTHIGLTGLKKNIPQGEWVQLTPEDTKHAEVQEAIHRGWVKISLTKPDGPGVEAPKIEFDQPAVHGSKTIPAKKAKKETT